MSTIRTGAAIVGLAALIGCGAPARRPDTPEPATAGAQTPPAAAPTTIQPKPAAPALPPPPAPPAVDPAALIDDGEEAASSGDLRTARSRFEEAVAIDPGLPEGHYNLGVLAEWQGAYDDAADRYRAALKARPTFGPAVVAIGRLDLREGNAESALGFARRQLQAQPDDPSLRNALNRLRLDADREVDQIEADSKAVLRADEKNVEAMINLAAAYHRQGRHELAVAILRNARALAPENPEILFRIALAHRALDEGIKARLALEEATRLPGGATAEIHNNLGLVYHAAGDHPGAEAQFRKALDRWPDMLAARINLGNALKGQQRFAEADEVLQRALDQAPREPAVLYDLGILHLDGQFPGVDPIRRLEQSLAFFERYKQTAGARQADDPVDSYIAEAKKRIEVERKRSAQQRTAPKAPPAQQPDPPAEPPAPDESDPFEDEK